VGFSGGVGLSGFVGGVDMASFRARWVILMNPTGGQNRRRPRTGQPHPRVGTFYQAPEMVSTQPFADAHVLAQPALSYPKLVEPTSKRQQAGRVETTVHTSENSRSGLLFDCRMVSTQAAPSSRPGSTSFVLSEVG